MAKANVILGCNIDTIKWVEVHENNVLEDIIVVDYEYSGEAITYKQFILISSVEGSSYLDKYESVTFYKSMYVYPGMSGQMSTMNRKKR